MSYIIATIFSQKFIGNADLATHFLEKLNQVGLVPEKIGLFEPLRTPYSFEKAIEMWTKEEPGCYEDGVGMIGKAGGMAGKLKEPKFEFVVQWWRHPNKKYINYINFYLTQKSFLKMKETLLALFRDTVEAFDAIYGYISHEVPKDRQHVTGSIETRMPGVFWCNYFNEKFVNFFGREKLISYPWFKTETSICNGIITYLAEDPHKELVESNEKEKRAKNYLGEESFGDIAEYLANPSKIQMRKVPELE